MRWVPLLPNVWKINVDASFCEELQRAWDFVVRDHPSDGVLAEAGRIGVVCDALCAQAHACIAALLQAPADHGMQNILVGTDSQTLVKALQTEELDRAKGGCYSEKRNSLWLPCLVL